MSLETKSKSFLVHEIERLQSVIKEKDVEIALLKEGVEKPPKQPLETIITPIDREYSGAEIKSSKKRKFSFEREDE
jgi:hypothetical protein